jgi:hypothetical protein
LCREHGRGCCVSSTGVARPDACRHDCCPRAARAGRFGLVAGLPERSGHRALCYRGTGYFCAVFFGGHVEPILQMCGFGRTWLRV